jgi:hypothetical protein
MSDSNKVNYSYGGPGIWGYLFLLFTGLKLAGIGPVATWSWWAVTAPLWGPLVFGIVVFLVVAVLAALAAAFSR